VSSREIHRQEDSGLGDLYTWAKRREEEEEKKKKMTEKIVMKETKTRYKLRPGLP
jgi:hypothetical protein